LWKWDKEYLASNLYEDKKSRHLRYVNVLRAGHSDHMAVSISDEEATRFESDAGSSVLERLANWGFPQTWADVAFNWEQRRASMTAKDMFASNKTVYW